MTLSRQPPWAALGWFSQTFRGFASLTVLRAGQAFRRRRPSWLAAGLGDEDPRGGEPPRHIGSATCRPPRTLLLSALRGQVAPSPRGQPVRSPPRTLRDAAPRRGGQGGRRAALSEGGAYSARAFLGRTRLFSAVGLFVQPFTDVRVDSRMATSSRAVIQCDLIGFVRLRWAAARSLCVPHGPASVLYLLSPALQDAPGSSMPFLPENQPFPRGAPSTGQRGRETKARGPSGP